MNWRHGIRGQQTNWYDVKKEEKRKKIFAKIFLRLWVSRKAFIMAMQRTGIKAEVGKISPLK